MLQPTHLRDLRVEPGSHPRGQQHLSAASGLVRVGEWLYLVADDEHHLGLMPADGAPAGWVQLLRMLPGDLPAGKRERKRHKPDFEALAFLPPVPGHPEGALWALGSGSRPNRERALLMPIAGGQPPAGAAAAIDLAGLYEPLRAEFPDLNIEGAFVDGQRVRLLQRGNKGDARNACIEYSLTELWDWLAGERRQAPPALAVRQFSLGDADGVPLGFTDGAARAGGGWVFSAAAEDTHDSYRDGACAASAIGWVSEDGTLERLERIAGAPKVEGIAFAADGRLLAVTDADDPARPSALLALDLR
jgi:hypothetical protein